MNSYKNKNLKKFIESIPQEEIDKQTQLQEENNKRVYKEFIDALKINKCFLCGGQINSFEESKPCFHWFTNPSGIKKKHFKKYLEKPIGFFQLDSYLRWLANTEKPFGNINDLKGETSKSSFLETTIRYKNIEWSFSIGHTDKEGHPSRKVGAVPHFHIQMFVDNRIFIKFSDFHIQFTDGNLFTLELLEQAGDRVNIGHSFGWGLGIIEDEEKLEYIESLMTSTEGAENASFNRQTIIEMPEGQTMSGEQIQKAIEKSKRTKRPIGKILQENFKDARGVTIIVPGDGVPEMKKRSGKK
jgi:hypothetical protein